MDTITNLDEQNQTTRQRVLKTLLLRQQCTVNELAEAVQINPISVRHHLNKLEAEGLVRSFEERHGVGRPRRLYRLTEAGKELFPTRYLRLTTRLLSQLKDQLPHSMIIQLFAQMAKDIASEYEESLKDLPIEERLDLIKRLLSQEGFSVEWEKQGNEYFIREISCPYLQVSQAHPEVCAIDQTLISTLLSLPAKKVRCVLNGDTNCTYVVSQRAKE
ncbi:MAG: ArsR family transcriptional regulator [Anaerolineales bacterium]|nr:ArsR family transcriptional regulator [Anaerolineales bacterium]MDW8160946.1 ArsR family transcriptional regulator [Anaerolineales bacterium]